MTFTEPGNLQERYNAGRAHPLRSQILDLIAREPLAASDLEQQLRQPIRKIADHLGTLRDLDLIEPDHREQLDTMTKFTYRVSGEVAVLMAADAGEDEATGGRGGVSVRLLDLLQSTTLAIVFSPKDLAASQDMRARTVLLDEIAFEALAKELEHARTRFFDIAKEAEDRIDSTDRDLLTIDVLCLEASRG